MGTSSLLEFNEQHLSENPYWQVRTDLQHDQVIKTKVVSLKSVLDNVKYEQIVFIKIDAQGFDLDVLRSMGKEHLSRVQAGMLEIPGIKETSLYINENECLKDALNLLDEYGFDVYRIKPNDEAANEFNVYFKRKDINVKEHEEKYHLVDLRIYDGVNYWFLPSNKPVLNLPIQKKCCLPLRLLACLVPVRKLRRKIRGDI